MPGWWSAGTFVLIHLNPLLGVNSLGKGQCQCLVGLVAGRYSGIATAVVRFSFQVSVSSGIGHDHATCLSGAVKSNR